MLYVFIYPYSLFIYYVLEKVAIHVANFVSAFYVLSIVKFLKMSAFHCYKNVQINETAIQIFKKKTNLTTLPIFQLTLFLE